MLGKINDIQYLGCNISRIRSANPIISRDYLKKYYYYMTERYRIYRKKESGEKFPWTDNKILQTNSFTCVKRWQDRTSKWLIDNISNNPKFTYEDRFWRTIVFRIYNKVDTMVQAGILRDDFWNYITVSADEIDKRKDDVYTRAYKVVSLKYKHKEAYPNSNWRSLNLRFIRDYRESYEGKIPVAATLRADNAISWLKSIPGVGNFIAYQIFTDLTYINEYPISELEYTLCGPGCMAGINFLFESTDKMTYEETLFWLRDHIIGLFKSIDSNFDINEMFSDLSEDNRTFTLSDLQNSFCEFSKLIYLEQNRHKNPRKYKVKEN